MGGGYAMGVDLGSTTAKTVIFDAAGDRVAATVVQMGAVSREAARVSVDRALEAAGIGRSAVACTVGTGYGRRLIPGADDTFTEITCHARGASALWPGVRLVIDIGGQDSKVIAVDENGFAERFAMNDRCASGTGRFFEVLARALETDVADIAELAMSGTSDLEVSSMCATFAETEVISMLAEGAERGDIAASVHRAVAARALGLVAQVGKRSPVVMTGGVARNRAAVHFLAAALRLPLEVPSDPQIAGAYGAALIARDLIVRGVTDRSDVTFPARADNPGACAACDGQPGSAGLLQIGRTARE
jgi:(R)-2-hydroxyacyl-CoA dehydratese activating ATPase